MFVVMRLKLYPGTLRTMNALLGMFDITGVDLEFSHEKTRAL